MHSKRCEIEGIFVCVETVMHLILEGHGQGHKAMHVYIYCVTVKRQLTFLRRIRSSENTMKLGKEFYSCDKLVDSSYEVSS